MFKKVTLLAIVGICFFYLHPDLSAAGGASSDVDLDKIRVLDLEAALKVALRDNPTPAAAEARLRQAQEVVRQAQAAYYPQLDAFATASQVRLSDNAYQRSLQQVRLLDPSATIDDPEDNYTAGIGASWTLFDGFRRKFSNAAARYGEQESREALMDTQRLLLSAVANAFYRAQLAREDIAIAQADEDFNQRQVQEAELRRSVGAGSLSDVLNFKVQINAARASLIEAERQYNISMAALAALLGLSKAAFPSEMTLSRLQDETDAQLKPPDFDELATYAETRRPDILQSVNTLQRSQAQEGVQRSGFYPSISLNATVDGERTNSGRFEGDDFGSVLGVFLNYNLFEGGANLARLREAQARSVEAEKNLQSLKLSVANEVQEAVLQVRSAQKLLKLERTNASLVNQNRDLVEKEYAAGQGSLVRLNEAQRDLTRAQGRLALALAALQLTRFELDTTTGKSLEKYAGK
jgi:outer membrane protein TolC